MYAPATCLPRRRGCAYKAHFDVLLTAFGPGPPDLGQQLAGRRMAWHARREIGIAEEYLAPLGETSFVTR